VEVDMAVKEFVEEALALPVEQRAQIADVLLQSLNRTDPQIDAQWAEVAARRWAEIRSGTAKTTAGDGVFSRLREKYGK
jgi:putative addiction module component (TIGR02574 family)